MNTLKAVDGTDKGKAPPPQRGWARAIYHCVDANRGWSSIAEIALLLPAELPDSLLVDQDKVKAICSNMISAGFLIRKSGRYALAPRSFYDHQQKLRDKGKGTRDTMKRRDSRVGEVAYLVRPYWHWTTFVATMLLSFFLGYIVAIIFTNL